MTSPIQIQAPLVIQAPMTKIIDDTHFVGNLTGATPSVANLTTHKITNLSATNVTYFNDGQDGQTITILGDGNSTVVHDAGKIYCATGANTLLASNKVYRFTRYNKVWYQHG